MSERERAIFFLEGRWVFAGNIREEGDRIYLTRVVWCLRWTGGIDSLVRDPSQHKVRPHKPVNFPRESEHFRIPVGEDWGL